jgi:hypothetical protein
MHIIPPDRKSRTPLEPRRALSMRRVFLTQAKQELSFVAGILVSESISRERQFQVEGEAWAERNEAYRLNHKKEEHT